MNVANSSWLAWDSPGFSTESSMSQDIPQSQAKQSSYVWGPRGLTWVPWGLTRAPHIPSLLPLPSHLPPSLLPPPTPLCLSAQVLLLWAKLLCPFPTLRLGQIPGASSHSTRCPFPPQLLSQFIQVCLCLISVCLPM